MDYRIDVTPHLTWPSHTTIHLNSRDRHFDRLELKLLHMQVDLLVLIYTTEALASSPLVFVRVMKATATGEYLPVPSLMAPSSPITLIYLIHQSLQRIVN
jgi:hypothetical protein